MRDRRGGGDMGGRQLQPRAGFGAPPMSRGRQGRLIGQVIAAMVIAIGAGLLATNMAGAAASGWQVSKSFPAPVGELSGVSCVSATTCIAVGGNPDQSASQIVGSTDGGGTWTEQSAPSSSTGALLSVSCPTAGACVAVGSSENFDAPVIDATSNGGTTWTNETAPANSGPL